MQLRVSIIGGSSITHEKYQQVVDLGEEIANRGHKIICGGLTGTMEAVCKGAKRNEGETVGILPSEKIEHANEYVSTPIATGLGNARNVLVVMNGDGAIAVNGGSGTLSEIGHALDMEKPVAGIDTFDVPGVEEYRNINQAIDYIEKNASR